MVLTFINLLSTLIQYLNNKTIYKIWGIFFIYSAFVSLAIQLIILPIFLPQYHGGDGLLSGSDAYVYQVKAVYEANQINDLGWGAWQLRPKGWGVVGVISAFYAFVGIDKPMF